MDKNNGPVDKSSGKGSALNVEDLYRELKEWHSEHDTWLKDLDQWRREQRLVELLLYKMERALPDQHNTLDEHTKIIRKHKQRLDAYEKKFRDLLVEAEPHPGIQNTILKEHRLQKDLHLCERERHESLRRSHLAAMSELSLLTLVLEQTERP